MLTGVIVPAGIALVALVVLHEDGSGEGGGPLNVIRRKKKTRIRSLHTRRRKSSLNARVLTTGRGGYAAKATATSAKKVSITTGRIWETCANGPSNKTARKFFVSNRVKFF